MKRAILVLVASVGLGLFVSMSTGSVKESSAQVPGGCVACATCWSCIPVEQSASAQCVWEGCCVPWGMCF